MANDGEGTSEVVKTFPLYFCHVLNNNSRVNKKNGD